MGDYPLPKGFTKADLGKCEYAIRVKGAGGDTYEIGVVKRRDGKDAYTFLYDFYGGGNGLIKKLFADDAKAFNEWGRLRNGDPEQGRMPVRPLVAEYEAQVAEKQARVMANEGWQSERLRQPNGLPRVRIYREGGGAGRSAL